MRWRARPGRALPAAFLGWGALLGPAVLVVSGGCTPPPRVDAVARIGSEEVAYESFERYLEINVGPEMHLSGEVLAHLFDQFLDEALLRREAEARGLVPAASGPRQAIEALLAAEAEATIGADEVHAYYEAHRAELEKPERVRLRQILVAEREEAERVAAELAAGEDFAEVAGRFSIDPSAPYGGDQGELSRQDLPPGFVEPVFRLGPGEISNIVPAEYGFHIFQVVSHQPAQVVPFEEAAGEIRLQLERERADSRLERVLQDVRSRYNVTVYDQNLPFAYRGIYRVSSQENR